MSINTQIVGNAGLYYVCYKLTLLKWNVLPTSRNARGVDIVAYNRDATKTLTIQVKALSRRNAVIFGEKLDHLIADFVVVCRNVMDGIPECFILTPVEVKELIHKGGSEDKTSYWLEAKSYEQDNFYEKWIKKIGLGE